MSAVQNPIRSAAIARLALGVLVFACSLSSSAVAAEPNADGQNQPAVDDRANWIRFTDDLQKNQLDRYGQSGAVTWSPGAINLGKGAILWPEVTPGPILEVTWSLQFSALDADGDTIQSEFMIPLTSTRALIARIEGTRKKGRSNGTIEIQHELRTEGKPQRDLLRTFQLPDGIPSGKWKFTYRYGLLRISIDGRPVATGYVEHVRSVAGLMCFQQEGQLQIRHVDLRAAPRPIAKYTADQQQAFDAAATAYEQAQSGFEATDLRPATDEAEQAVRGFEAVLGERHPYTIKALGLLGHAQVSVAGKHHLARETLDRAMKLAREVFGDDHPEVAMLWTRMAAARLERNDDLGALRYYERALAIYADTHGENALMTGITGVQAGGAALNAGRLASAKQHLELALSRLEQAEGKNSVAAADARLQLGLLCTHEGNMPAAEAHLTTALASYRSDGQSPRECMEASMWLANLALARRNPKAAQEQYEIALDYSRTAFGEKSDAAAYLLGMLGLAAAEQGRRVESVQYAQQAADMMQELRGEHDHFSAIAIGMLAAAHADSGDSQRAVPLYWKSLQINLGLAKEVLPALSETEGLEYVQGVYRDRGLYLEVAQRAGDVAAADVFRPVWESSALVSRVLEDRRQYRGFDAQGNQELAALRVARRQIATLSLAPPPQPERPAWQATLDRLTEEKEDLERKLGTRVPLVARRQQAAAESFETAVSRLPQTAALIQFVRAEYSTTGAENYHAFVLQPGAAGEEAQCCWIPLGPAKPIDDAGLAWRRELSGGERTAPDSPQSPAATLQSLVWARLEPQLKGVTHVILVPHGPLGLIPWGALPSSVPDRVLLQDYQFSLLAHGPRLGEILRETPHHLGATDRLLAAGGIDYGLAPPAARRRFDNLPGTLREVNGIAGLWMDAERLDVPKGLAATEAQLLSQLPTAQFLHLATHGFVEPAATKAAMAMPGPNWFPSLAAAPVRSQNRNPLALVALAVSGANELPHAARVGDETREDGLLTGEEVADLDLSKAQLVVLSACETGLGDTAGGEGVFGLQRAFEQAGARTTVASLWKVADEPTRVLMERFYESLWNKKLGRLEALREAQLWMLEHGAEQAGIRRDAVARGAIPVDELPTVNRQLPPYYWAAFVLSGDWR